MAYEGTFTFGGVTIQVTSMNAVQRQKQRKMVVGKKLNRINIMGVNVFQWELDLNILVTGTSQSDLYVNRAAIEALNDLATHAWVDGLHNGTYYMVPDSLSFTDTSDDAGSSFKGRFTLIEE